MFLSLRPKVGGQVPGMMQPAIYTQVADQIAVKEDAILLQGQEPLTKMERLAISVGLTRKSLAADKEGAEIFLPLITLFPKKKKKANFKAKSN